MITTTNASWGFFGTLRSNGATDAEAIYDDAARALMAKLGLTPDRARAVLDARMGRHMADQRQDGESGKELVERLLTKRGWGRDIRAAIRREVTLAIQHDEVAVLRFALDHALASISEAHAEDRAQLQALIERLEAEGGL